MAGFTTVDSVINALGSAGQGQYLLYSKTLPSTTAAGVPHSFWESTGLPSASNGQGASPSGSFICSSTMAGAMPYVNATTSMSMSIIAWDATPVAAAGLGTLILVDRICQMTLAHATQTVTVTGMDATSRLGSTEGGMIWAEVSTALSAGANTMTLTYTNESNVSHTTQTITTVASAIRGRNPTASLWIPLQSGDKGCRTITGYNYTGGTATGNITWCIVRVIAMIPQTTAGTAVSRDFVCEIPNLRKIYDNSCLNFIFIPNAAGTPLSIGAITIGQN